MLQEKRWLVKTVDEEIVKKLVKEVNVSPVVARILVAREMIDKDAVLDFLQGAKEPFYSPFLLKDMEKAVKRICLAIDKKEKVVIYGDYDVDGITASSLLYLFFSKYKVDIDYYIPERQSEGYGLNAAALQKIADSGVSLVITVDCGISAVETINSAPKTLDIIVTDHHNPSDVIPKALAVINPKQLDCLYPYKELAGVGVAFKLCQALYQRLGYCDDLWSEHLDLVALGTIADIVSLTGENREIVRLGLKAISNTTNLGLKALFEVARIKNKKVNTGTIGFMIGPRLNAAGRLSSALLGVQLLTTKDSVLANQIAQELETENSNRQEIERLILEQAEQLIAKQGGARDVLVLAHEGWHPGVIGIVASRLVDKYYLPTILISIDEQECKASCRSIPALDIYQALLSVEEYLIQFGGHRQAAGFSIEKSKIKDFRIALTSYVKKTLVAEDYIPKLNIEVLLDNLKAIDFRLVEDLSKLEPYGMANPSPLLAIKDVVVSSLSTVGVDGQHLKMLVRDDYTDVSTIMWRKGDYKSFLHEGSKLDLAFIPEINEWRNEKKINLRLIDIKKQRFLLDFRNNLQCKKEEMLSKVLSKDINTVVYCNETFEGLYVKKADVLLFDQLPCNKVEQVVFWQPPYKVLNNDIWWQKLKDCGVKYLYLLYDKFDVEKELRKLEEDFLNDNRLRDCYKSIRQNAGSRLENFTSEEQYLLKILLEIGAIVENDGILNIVPVVEGVRLQLTNSPTYKSVKEKEVFLKESLYKCMSLSQKDLTKRIFD